MSPAATSLGDEIATAYSATAAAWQHGPGKVYDRLAEVIVAHSPVPLAGRRVLDAGAGTGAASRALETAGASPMVAIDVAIGMLAHLRQRRPPAAVGDVGTLPFPAATFDAAIAAFCLNHLADPVAGLVELRRVLRPGGGLLAAAYAADDDHPAKSAVEAVLTELGWRPPPWYGAIHGVAERLASPPAFAAAANAAGFVGRARHVRVAVTGLTPTDLVAWRMGMAQHAPFVARLRPEQRTAAAAEAVRHDGVGGPLVRSIVVLSATRR